MGEISSKTLEPSAAQWIRISHLRCFYFRFFRLFRIRSRKASKMVDFVRNKKEASPHLAKLKIDRILRGKGVLNALSLITIGVINKKGLVT